MRKYVSNSNSPTTMKRGFHRVLIAPGSPVDGGSLTEQSAAIAPGQGVQELNDQLRLPGAERSSKLDPRHRVDCRLQGGGATVVEVGAGHGHVAEAGHPEDLTVPGDPGHVIAAEIDTRLLNVDVGKDAELLEHVAADVHPLMARRASVRLEQHVASSFGFREGVSLAPQVPIE